MKTQAAPANTWEVRMRWGDRALEAEVIDGRGRSQLLLGDRDTDDFVIADGARLELVQVPTGLEVRFTLGVSGTARLADGTTQTLGQLVEQQRAREVKPGQFQLMLGQGDALELQVAGQHLDVRPAKARVARLGVDVLAMVALVTALSLLTAWVVTTVMGMTPLNLIPKEERQKTVP